jgi:hypothetical protein
MVWMLVAIAAQITPVPSAQAPAAWDPAADYITAGQDEPGYRSWYLAMPARAIQVKAFNDYLATWKVAGILPTWQLFRTATAWEQCGGQPFEIPPTSEWPNIVQTLRYVHDYVVPAVGPVEAVSVYRNPALNQCAGGAPESAHKHYSAIDMVPLRPTTREDLMRALCADQARRGPDYQVGLGFYAFLRFHVDTQKFRRWNMDPAVAAQCPPIVHPEDSTTIGQPLPQSQPATVTPPPATPEPPSSTPETQAPPPPTPLAQEPKPPPQPL